MCTQYVCVAINYATTSQHYFKAETAQQIVMHFCWELWWDKWVTSDVLEEEGVP